MHMTGVDTLALSTISTARETINSVEISLVLDVSGSMWSRSRLTNLKIAAQDFVDEMFENSETGTVTISIIPYATQVTAPPELFAELTTHFYENGDPADEAAAAAFALGHSAANPNPAMLHSHYNGHVLSHCINWQDEDFESTQISTSTSYERTLHFDPWGEFDGWRRSPKTLVGSAAVCRSDPSRQMRVLSDNPADLKAFIRSFVAGGNTSLDVGMKWGSALVDPSFQPITQALAHESVGMVNPNFANRPVPYSDDNTIKVVVLMTDGQNTSQHFIEDRFRSGDSPIWFNEEEGFYSVYLGQDVDDDNRNGLTDDPLFYWPDDDDVPGSGDFHAHAYGGGAYTETEDTYDCLRYRYRNGCHAWRKVAHTGVLPDEPGTARVLPYEQLWAYTTQEWIADNIFAEIIGASEARTEWDRGGHDYYGRADKDSRTLAICDATKENGTIVFTIGFEAPNASQTLLTNCASSPAHFFDVDGLEIADAFSAIASSIRQLRLTQ